MADSGELATLAFSFAEMVFKEALNRQAVHSLPTLIKSKRQIKKQRWRGIGERQGKRQKARPHLHTMSFPVQSERQGETFQQRASFEPNPSCGKIKSGRPLRVSLGANSTFEYTSCNFCPVPLLIFPQRTATPSSKGFKPGEQLEGLPLSRTRPQQMTYFSSPLLERVEKFFHKAKPFCDIVGLDQPITDPTHLKKDKPDAILSENYLFYDHSTPVYIT